MVHQIAEGELDENGAEDRRADRQPGAGLVDFEGRLEQRDDARRGDHIRVRADRDEETRREDAGSRPMIAHSGPLRQLPEIVCIHAVRLRIFRTRLLMCTPKYFLIDWYAFSFLISFHDQKSV